jgi:hypothetical protein
MTESPKADIGLCKARPFLEFAYDDDDQLDESRPIPETNGGFLHYRSLGNSGEYLTIDDAKARADAQKWGRSHGIGARGFDDADLLSMRHATPHVDCGVAPYHSAATARWTFERCCNLPITVKRLLARGFPLGPSMRIKLLDGVPVALASLSKPTVALM